MDSIHDDDDDDISTIFIILFAVSAGINLLIAIIAVIYCVMSKKRSSLPHSRCVATFNHNNAYTQKLL